MTNSPVVLRPVPRWLLAFAVLASAVSLFLLVLGQLVTTLKAGMADPAWPTEPWYLINNYKAEVGYLVEHSHRIAGFTLGAILGLLTLGIWWFEPRGVAKWIGIVAVAVLLAGFGEFHRVVMAQTDPNRLDIPMRPVAMMGGALLLLGVIGLSGLATGVRGSGLRLFSVVVLLAVMTQGVLGGLRVRLNALHGPELAAVHGAFAQVAFCLIVMLTLFCTRPPATPITAAERGTVGSHSVMLVVLLLCQLILGVLVRHLPTPAAQRLHFFTAFLAVALVVGVLRAGYANAATRPRVGRAGVLLGVFVLLQVLLGVEAWMGRFSDEARAGLSPEKLASYQAENEVPTPAQTAIRTSHVMVGTGLLATAVVLAVAVRRRAGVPAPVDESQESWAAPGAPRAELAQAGVSPSGERT